MSYEINLRFRRFSCGTGQMTGLIVYYIAPRPKDARHGSSVSRAHDLAYIGTQPRTGTISACTVTMDHNAVVCLMIDRPARGPDKDVHVPSVGSPKYPFRGVDAIYL